MSHCSNHDSMQALRDYTHQAQYTNLGYYILILYTFLLHIPTRSVLIIHNSSYVVLMVLKYEFSHRNVAVCIRPLLVF